MNRIEAMITKVRDRLTRCVKADGSPADSEATQKSEKEIVWENEEVFKFQNLKSAAMGKFLSEEEAMSIYQYLGGIGTADHINSKDLAVRSVLMQVFSELLALRIKGEF